MGVASVILTSALGKGAEVEVLRGMEAMDRRLRESGQGGTPGEPGEGEEGRPGESDDVDSQFVDDAEADALLTRPEREPYVVPEEV